MLNLICNNNTKSDYGYFLSCKSNVLYLCLGHTEKIKRNKLINKLLFDKYFRLRQKVISSFDNENGMNFRNVNLFSLRCFLFLFIILSISQIRVRYL